MSRPKRASEPTRPVAVRLPAELARALRARPGGASGALRAALTGQGPDLARRAMRRAFDPPPHFTGASVRLSVRLSPDELRQAAMLGARLRGKGAVGRPGSVAAGLRWAATVAAEGWHTKLGGAMARLRAAQAALGAEGLAYETRGQAARPPHGHDSTITGPMPGPKKATDSGLDPKSVEKGRKAR